MFYVLQEKSLLVLKVLLLLPVKHAQICFSTFYSKDTTKKGTHARDFLNCFSKTAAQIILASASHFLQVHTRYHIQLFYAECFCISLFVLVPPDLTTLDNPSSAKTWGMAAGPAHTLKGLWKAKTRINMKKTVINHFPEVL